MCCFLASAHKSSDEVAVGPSVQICLESQPNSQIPHNKTHIEYHQDHSSLSRDMPSRESREVRNLRVDGTPALISGPVPRRSLPSYKWRGGARYANDGSASAMAYAAEANKVVKLPKDVYLLETIVGKREEDEGHVQYLARWAEPYTADDDTWEPPGNFRDQDIQEYEDRTANDDLEHEEVQEAVGSQTVSQELANNPADNVTTAPTEEAKEDEPAYHDSNARGSFDQAHLLESSTVNEAEAVTRLSQEGDTSAETPSSEGLVSSDAPTDSPMAGQNTQIGAYDDGLDDFQAILDYIDTAEGQGLMLFNDPESELLGDSAY